MLAFAIALPFMLVYDFQQMVQFWNLLTFQATLYKPEFNNGPTYRANADAIFTAAENQYALDIAAAENLDPAGSGPDEDLQRLLGEMAREEPPDPEDELDGADESDRLPSAGAVAQGLFYLFLAVLGAIMALLYAYKMWRRLAPLFASSKQRPAASFRVTLDRLAEAGIAREYGETREQFAKRAAAVCPPFERATALMLAHTLGWPGTPPDIAAWKQVTREAKAEMNANTKWWRRLLGLMHPLSFLDAR